MKRFRRGIVSVFISVLAFNTVAFGASHEKMQKVIHAGGTIYNSVGTNSLEALSNSYFMGERYIELDFCFTTDNHLVSIHDWDINYFGANYSSTFHGAVGLEEFKSKRILGEFTPVTVEKLQDWILGKPETYIITDIKERNIEGLKYIKENYPLLVPRIIPQVYSEAEFTQVKALGYTDVIYTLYTLTYVEKMDAQRINAFAKENDVLAVVFDKTLATKEYVEKLTAGGVRVFAHTVNENEEVIRLKEMGIDGVYTDLVL